MDEPNEERMEEAYDEAELSDDEFEELSFDDLLDRVESNDPSLTKRKVRLRTHIPNDEDDRQHKLERLSTAIGRNTHLKAVAFDVRLMSDAQLKNLCLGVACNQSIKRLRFSGGGAFVGIACRILTPLFKNNQVERIRIYNCDLSLDSTHLLATSLAMFDSLKEFALTSNTIQYEPDVSQQLARELMQALSGHSGLRKLDLSSNNIGKLGCSALVDLLSNPNTNLRVLTIASIYLGDAEAVALSSGMDGNVSLKEINLACNSGITQAGWQALFDALNHSSCRLEKLKLGGNNINDAAAQSLSSALASNTSIKTLDLEFIRGITLTGWRVLFGALRSPTCVLENLDLNSNQLKDEVMSSLTEALASNRTLKSLNLFSTDGVTGNGWQRFFSIVLSNPGSGLEDLVLGGCENINDAAIRSITNALLNNSKLKVLILNGNYLITNAGCEMFSSVLESPHTAMEELHLDGNEIDDDTLTSLVNSLANNKKLKEFFFDHSEEWEPPLSVLYNSDNTMSTYNSNHALQKVGRGYGDEMPEEFESLLQINRENSPRQAAKLKIIKTHFSGGFITLPFAGMDLNMLPHAMAWMGRDRKAVEVDGHYFSFIKSIASLFENAN